MDFESFNKKYLPYTPHFIQGIDGKGQKSSFGANGESGFLSKEAFKKLTDFCSFPGMGAAEFEFDKLPDALQRLSYLYKNKTLILKSEKFGPSNVELFILCFDDQFDQIVNTYKKWTAFTNTRDSFKFACPKGRDLFLETIIDFKAQINSNSRKGWISLDSYNYPYMIFISKQMAVNFVKHFQDNPNLKYKKKREGIK